MSLKEQEVCILITFLNKFKEKHSIDISKVNMFEKNFFHTSFETVQTFLSTKDIKLEKEGSKITIPESKNKEIEHILQDLISKIQKNSFDYPLITITNIKIAQQALIQRYSSFFTNERIEKFKSVKFSEQTFSSSTEEEITKETEFWSSDTEIFFTNANKFTEEHWKLVTTHYPSDEFKYLSYFYRTFRSSFHELMHTISFSEPEEYPEFESNEDFMDWYNTYRWYCEWGASFAELEIFSIIQSEFPDYFMNGFIESALLWYYEKVIRFENFFEDKESVLKGYENWKKSNAKEAPTKINVFDCQNNYKIIYRYYLTRNGLEAFDDGKNLDKLFDNEIYKLKEQKEYTRTDIHKL